MKAALLFTLLVGSALAAPQVEIKAEMIFEDLVVSILECVRALLIEGIADIGLPSFDHLEVVDFEIDLSITDSEGISGRLFVTDLTFSGIVDFVISNVSGNIILIPPGFRFSLSLLFPNPALTTIYELELTSANIDYELNGEGTLTFDCNNLSSDVAFRLTLTDGVTVHHIRAPIALDGCSTFEITGVRGDADYSAYISQQGLENASYWVSVASPRFEEILADGVQAAINAPGAGDLLVYLTDCL